MKTIVFNIPQAIATKKHPKDVFIPHREQRRKENSKSHP
jgi:hypothetical protein